MTMGKSEGRSSAKGVDERRRGGDRLPVSGVVTVSMPALAFEGPSENVSRDGVYFTAKQNLDVEVTLPNGTTRKGHIMRVGAVRDGEFGIAVRFAEPLSQNDLPNQDA